MINECGQLLLLERLPTRQNRALVPERVTSEDTLAATLYRLRSYGLKVVTMGRTDRKKLTTVSFAFTRKYPHVKTNTFLCILPKDLKKPNISQFPR